MVRWWKGAGLILEVVAVLWWWWKRAGSVAWGMKNDGGI